MSTDGKIDVLSVCVDLALKPQKITSPSGRLLSAHYIGQSPHTQNNNQQSWLHKLFWCISVNFGALQIILYVVNNNFGTQFCLSWHVRQWNKRHPEISFHRVISWWLLHGSIWSTIRIHFDVFDRVWQFSDSHAQICAPTIQTVFG